MLDTSKVKILTGVPANIAERIVSNVPKEHFDSGSVIFMEGEFSNGKAYIIESGKVKVSLKGKHLANLEIGDAFGEMGLLSEDVRNATIEALEDCELIILSITDLLNIINTEGEALNKEILKRIEENIAAS